jgi:hypothetical protein|tara:strand:+ start:71 stop:328 length:258 start_codon:yes stop_codon:yes gene_type:complete
MSWREQNNEVREEYLAWVHIRMKARWDEGAAKYDTHIDGFRGDPMEHMVEELLDSIFYWWYEKRRQSVVGATYLAGAVGTGGVED